MRHLRDFRSGRDGTTCACGRPLDRCWRYRIRTAVMRNPLTWKLRR